MPPVWDLENKQYSNIAFLEAGIEEQPSTWKVLTAVFAAGWFTYSIYSTAAGLWKWLGSKLEERNKRLVEQVAQQVQQVQQRAGWPSPSDVPSQPILVRFARHLRCYGPAVAPAPVGSPDRLEPDGPG